MAIDGAENGNADSVDENRALDIARKVAQFQKKSLGDQRQIYEGLLKTYWKHLSKYGQTPGATWGETNRMERELQEMQRILADRGRTFADDGTLMD